MIYISLDVLVLLVVSLLVVGGYVLACRISDNVPDDVSSQGIVIITVVIMVTMYMILSTVISMIMGA